MSFKDIVKRILPPPVHAFNREIERVMKAMEEHTDRIESQNSHLYQYMEKQLVEQEKCLALLEQQMAAQKQQLETLGFQQAALQTAQDKAHAETREQQKKLADHLNKVHKQTIEAARQASEAVWAEIFNNTIVESAWLKDKTFSPGRWAVGYPYLYVMYRVLNETRPKRILELGLGQSTRMIAQYAAAFDDVEHIVVEQDSDWIDFFKRNYTCPGSTKLMHLPAKEIEFLDDDKTLVYQNFGEQFENIQFDFISVDGPGHSQSDKYRRIDLLELIPNNIAQSFCILFDDLNDVFCNNAYEVIVEKINRNISHYCEGFYIGRKKISIVASNDKSFLCSL